MAARAASGTSTLAPTQSNEPASPSGIHQPARFVAVTSDSPPAGGAVEVPTFEYVTRSHGRFIYTVAYRLTGNHDEAQDLVQEVLLRVRRGLASYRPGSMEAWLSRITTNAFLDEVRRKKRRPLDVVPDLPERVTGVDQEPLDVLDTSRLPDHIQEALKSLPIEFRSAVVLCDVVGLNYQEIAESLDVPVGTVRSRIHRGRAQLRAMLG